MVGSFKRSNNLPGRRSKGKERKRRVWARGKRERQARKRASLAPKIPFPYRTIVERLPHVLQIKARQCLTLDGT